MGKILKTTEKVCVRCGERFITAAHNAKYCPECRFELTRGKIKWKNMNKKENKND